MTSPDDDLENKADEYLLKVLNKNYSYPDAMRIKAQSILRSREQADAQQKHNETIAESRKSNKLSISAIAISVLSLLVAFVALHIAYRSLSIEQQKLKTELNMPTTIVSQPTKTTNANKQNQKSQQRGTIGSGLDL